MLVFALLTHFHHIHADKCDSLVFGDLESPTYSAAFIYCWFSESNLARSPFQFRVPGAPWLHCPESSCRKGRGHPVPISPPNVHGTPRMTTRWRTKATPSIVWRAQRWRIRRHLYDGVFFFSRHKFHVDGEIPLLLQRDAGIVESITLKNFMCHSNLGPFTFGSNVNFVVGHNGSECRCLVVCLAYSTFVLHSLYKSLAFILCVGGKSAILTGLIVALGGNALATNRGSSLKGFVKEGER